MLFIYVPVANAVGDMLLICAVYGRDAYFKEGLRIVKHKPFTLSTGIVFSQKLDQLGWLLDTVLWLGFVFLTRGFLV
ncbi:MAG: hypothetical protein JWR69_795 [Pedosphaera sp.]|nr:hypothetical protein [Pedosphaera sp.]